MSIRYVLECELCHKVSQEVGDDGFTGSLGFCGECRQIANAVRDPNRPRDSAVCSYCFTDAHLLPLRRGGREVRHPHQEESMDCPWCGAPETLRTKGHALVQPVFSSPEPGDLVHCRLIGRCDQGYVGIVDPLSYLFVSGGGDNELHSWCEAEISQQCGHAIFRRRVADSGDDLLDELEVYYQDEPCLLVQAGEIARMTAKDPLRYWDLWQCTVGFHTAKQAPAKTLRGKTAFWTLDLAVLFIAGNQVSELVRLWHPVEKIWLALEQVRGTVGFPDGNKLEWLSPWDNSGELAERIRHDSWSLTLSGNDGEVLWDFPMGH